MSKLTDTELVILSAASQRPDRRILPLPERLKGGAARNVIGALIAAFWSRAAIPTETI